MTTALETTEKQPLENKIPLDMSLGAMQSAFAGDLSKLPESERLKFYGLVCQTVGLNPMTRPFEWITFQGKLTLYANKGCAEQLRQIHDVSIEIVKREIQDGVLIVHAKATRPTGRTDEAIGAVAFATGMPADVKAIAVMKCETKAKRRVTLSICGLGMLDQSEVEDLPKNRVTEIVTGEISAEERAANLNKFALTDGEKSKAIEVPTAPQKESPIQASVAPSTQNIATSEKAELLPASDGARLGSAEPMNDKEAMARELEILFGENKNCIAYCVNQGKLAKGKGLAEIDAEYGVRILKFSAAFIRNVEAWAKKGAK